MNTRLEKAPIIPLIQADDPAIAVRTTEALIAGGLTVIEVVLRTEAALHCLTEIAKACPKAIVGAGTVLSEKLVNDSARAGAQFIVSPGLDKDVVAAARHHGLPIYPGVATASEVQLAWNLGLRTVKFFPAGLAGGPKMIQTLSSVFKDLHFMPTGGVTAENLGGYLDLPSVIACGGSWLTPKSAILSGNFEEITRLAKAAIAIAKKTRK
ncbi:MAG: 2-dehydro-3-deoxyphosphogluconate aldolase [Alphaproteobacteria bacterium]|nr:MAG: 2-dehydro-3-deoxyphosphogluconate aldolase [Alphaproteobacteria bacterium]